MKLWGIGIKDELKKRLKKELVWETESKIDYWEAKALDRILTAMAMRGNNMTGPWEKAIADLGCSLGARIRELESEVYNLTKGAKDAKRPDRR